MKELEQLQIQLETQMKTLDPNVGQWYVTIDASQIPASADINWQDISAQYQWGNLLAGSMEGEEPDLTCWLAQLNDDILKFSLELAKQYPFSCTWLQSTWSTEQISKHWQMITDAHLPEGKRGLLRFYDACVLQILPTILKKEQWFSVYAPCIAWLYIDRTGTLGVLQSPAKMSKANDRIKLNTEQLIELEMNGQADHVIANLIAEEYLSLESNPFENYAKVSAAITKLKQYGIIDTVKQYAFCMLTLDWPVKYYQTPHLEKQLQQVQQGKLDLYTVKPISQLIENNTINMLD